METPSVVQLMSQEDEGQENITELAGFENRLRAFQVGSEHSKQTE